MASPAAWLIGAVAAADTATADLGLQVEVSHEAWSGKDGYGKPTYAAAVTRSALVQEGTNQVRLVSGETITTRACISFLRPVAVDPRDRITLPSGYTGPIVDNVGALVHTGPAAPISVVWLR